MLTVFFRVPVATQSKMVIERKVTHVLHLVNLFVNLFLQYEDSGALDIFLTPSQKAWFTTLKKAANKKPKKMISRPQVSTMQVVRTTLLIEPEKS